MPDVTADSAKKTDQNRPDTGEKSALDGCYRQIGISAVAAAARYQGDAKNPAYAPASTTWHDRMAEAAA